MRNLVMLGAAACIVALTAPALAEESCEGSGTPLTQAAVEAKLKEQGYVQIKEIKQHNGCYEAKGYDKDGKRFELEINAYTGAIDNAE
jgi:hypothetical protein